MATRITRAPKSKGAKGPKGPKGAIGPKNAKGKKGAAIPKEAKAGFESHSGRDLLLGANAKKGVSESLIRESPTKSTLLKKDAKGKGGALLEGGLEGKAAKGKGAKGADGKALSADGKALSTNKKAADGSASAKGDLAAKELGKAEQSKQILQGKEAQKTGEKAELQQSQAEAKEGKKGLLGGLKKQVTGMFKAAKQKAAGGKAEGQAGGPGGADGNASADGKAMAQMPAGEPGGAKSAEAGAKGAGGVDGKASADGASQTANGQKANGKSAGPQGSIQRSLTQQAPGAKGARGAAGAYSAEGSQLASSSQTPAKSNGKSAAQQAVSLRSLHFEEAKAENRSKENSADSPRQQLRTMLKNVASAKEFAILQQAHGVTPGDAAAVAQKIAVLAQTGQLPVSDILSTLIKILKRPGNQKKLQKIKEVLVKKGVISAGISTETLELIAAMIALYLAKGGNEDAELLIADLFSMPSRKLELPDGGGEHHQEGREEERHAEHQRGESVDLDNYISGL